MNALTRPFSTQLPRPRNRDRVPSIVRPIRRERDFGIGYGSSSGYASTARYAPNQTTPRFRCG